MLQKPKLSQARQRLDERELIRELTPGPSRNHQPIART
jgi:hypothetical protein